MVQGLSNMSRKNNYTGPIRCNRENVTSIQGPVQKHDKTPNRKRYSFNVITQILAIKIIYNITIKDSCALRIIDPAILKLCIVENYEPLYVCDQYVIKFGTRKYIIGFCNKDDVDSWDKYPSETINNTMKVMKDKILI